MRGSKTDNLATRLPTCKVHTRKTSLNDKGTRVRKLSKRKLLKYGGYTLYASAGSVFNNVFKTHEDVNLEIGTLIPLQKPGKAVGFLSHLRPVVLLTTLRKAFSLLVLHRVLPKVQKSLSLVCCGLSKVSCHIPYPGH